MGENGVRNRDSDLLWVFCFWIPLVAAIVCGYYALQERDRWRDECTRLGGVSVSRVCYAKEAVLKRGY